MDNLREWISDNLRYLILGVGVLLVILAVLFGVRSCSGGKKTDSSGTQNTVAQNSNPSSETDGTVDVQTSDEPLVQDDVVLLDLVSTYYHALGNRDGNAVSALAENMSSSDVAAVINANNYITGYDVEHVYSKPGLTDGTYVVYVKYKYSCNGIDAQVPALSQMYVVTAADGSLKIDANAENDPEISAYMTKVMNDSDVKALRSEAEQEYNEAISSNPDLAGYLNSRGEESMVSSGTSEGQTMTANEECNVREEPSSDAEIIGGLSEGDEVETLGREGDWVKIEYDGQIAYVHADLLS